MKTNLYYLETASQDPAYNLAFEEYVLTHKKDGDYLLLWQNHDTIVVGQNQNAEEEINRSFVEEHGIQVVRRITGGGAVYHDLGNLNYSYITDAKNLETMTMAVFTNPVIDALRKLGVTAESSGRNDILINGCKVSGTAQRQVGGRILHHGTLLFDSDLEMVSGALRADPEKYRSKGIKSVRSRVGNIRGFLPVDMTLDEFWTYLRITLTCNGFTTITMNQEDLAQIQTLKVEKYDTWQWNIGASPQYEMRQRRRFAGGTLDVRLTVKDGRIADIAFYGDFLSLCPVIEVSQALIDCPFQEEAISRIMMKLPIEKYFGLISTKEILQTLF